MQSAYWKHTTLGQPLAVCMWEQQPFSPGEMVGGQVFLHERE